MRLVFAALVGAALAGAGCDDSLAGVGQPCASSGDCAPGLLCDFGKTPHVCEPMESIGPRDLSALRDLSVHLPDGADLATNPTD